LTQEGLSYASAGVDIAANEKALERVRPLIESTFGDAAGKFGQFAGTYELPALGHLAASTDSVGTKVKVAIALGKHRGIGVDLVNHCVNDIAVGRARPLFFLDYFATGKLDPDVFAELVEGMASACRDAGMPLLGGETAELPGLYVLVGLPSNGLHTNGFSLARRVFEGAELPAELLDTHRSYLRELNALEWKSAAHITGGGIPGNLPRALPASLTYRLDLETWEVPGIFREIQERGGISEEEMFGTFNMGIGMVLVMDRGDVPEGANVIGVVVSA
jgi:phosphoribosylformylglycinamidine cyclo-ligase